MIYENVDLAQVMLYLFWIFFAGLVIYLRREDRREGYPLESDTMVGRLHKPSLIFFPSPKSLCAAARRVAEERPDGPRRYAARSRRTPSPVGRARRCSPTICCP